MDTELCLMFRDKHPWETHHFLIREQYRDVTVGCVINQAPRHWRNGSRPAHILNFGIRRVVSLTSAASVFPGK
jgi:hypothetical protein